MKVALLVFSIALTLVGELYPQQSEKARLVRTWSGGEDPSEFIYHSVEEFAFSYLPDNPDGKIIARVCSTRAMSEALAKSSRVVKGLPAQVSFFRFPAEKVFFARSSKCKNGDQYWFVPGSIDIEYDELVLARRVRINQWWTTEYDKKIDSAEAKNKFMISVREFVAEMKSNSKNDGFLFPNRRYQIRELRRQLKAEGVDDRRVRIPKERPWDTYYPRLVTVDIK